MIELWVAAVGVVGPGLTGWEEAAAVLANRVPYARRPLDIEVPALLNGRERRRTSETVRLALSVAQQCMSRTDVRGTELAAVFGSSNSDGMTVHHLLEAMADPNGFVSPTQFHNSVHNAASGYWSIGTGSQRPASSIAAHDFTFGATLLKSALQAAAGQSVLMVAYDMPFPEPLHAKRPLADGFAVAFILEPEPRSAAAALTVAWSPGAPARECGPSLRVLHPLWAGNPAARSLPLLEALAHGRPADVELRYPADGTLTLSVRPC